MRYKTNKKVKTYGPVFYDGSGKRWHRVLITIAGVVVVVLAAGVWIIPEAFAPVRYGHYNQDSEFPRRFLAAENERAPVVGDVTDGVLTRVVQAKNIDGNLEFVDPFTGVPLREATDIEKDEVGDSKYAIEHYGRPTDHQLMLTFDDGPDSEYTPEILDILSREKVPATFFVIGSNIVENPEVLDRIIREGHMVGNHTMSHTGFDSQTNVRNREELIGTDRIIRASARYETRLFRIPKGDPDHNVLTLLQSQQLGYLHADMDVDTLDWKMPPGQQIPIPLLDGRGHVVLMHDGGGDRSATVEMLGNLIKQAKSQGYTFSTMAPLLPPDYFPERNIKPTIADHATLLALKLAWEVPHKLLGWLFWLGVISLGAMSLFYLSLATANHKMQKKRFWIHRTCLDMPYVSVVIAAYNEEKVIRKTISKLRQSDYPKSRLEVIVVNDGSKDDTGKVLDGCAREWIGMKVIHQPNGGKSSAVNNGVKNARPESRIIVTLDADTLFQRDTISLLVRHFLRNTHGKHRKPLGAVAGHVKVGNRCNILTAWQSLEYISGICINRLAEDAINAIAIVPGACSAWNRHALEQIGGLSEDTLAEDADATLQLHRCGYRIEQENEAVAYTEAPETIRALSKQRLRWMYGNVQVLWKHRSMMLRPKYGMLGMVSLPYALISLLIPLLFLPPTLVAAAICLSSGNWTSVVLFALFVMTLHMITSIVAVVAARERAWHLLVVPIYRLIYEPLRAYLLYASLLRMLKGAAVGWNKLERLNSVAVSTAN